MLPRIGISLPELKTSSPGCSIGLAHGWGDPDDPRLTQEKGSNVQQLIPGDVNFNKITGLVQQSTFPGSIDSTRS